MCIARLRCGIRPSLPVAGEWRDPRFVSGGGGRVRGVRQFDPACARVTSRRPLCCRLGAGASHGAWLYPRDSTDRGRPQVAAVRTTPHPNFELTLKTSSLDTLPRASHSGGCPPETGLWRSLWPGAPARWADCSASSPAAIACHRNRGGAGAPAMRPEPEPSPSAPGFRLARACGPAPGVGLGTPGHARTIHRRPRAE